jgi:predicted dehydrogenase
MKRKDFVKKSTLVAAAAAIAPSYVFAQKKPTTIPKTTNDGKVNVIMMGVGLRGQNHLHLLLDRNDVNVMAICDIDDRMLQTSKAMIEKSGKNMPQIFTGDIYAWKKMLELKNIHAVIISTPWEWHKEMIIESVQAGIKYVGTEVMLGITLQDHFDVVTAAEKHKAHVCMLENVCYRRDVMAVLNMVRQGVLGEIVHLQGGYQHDLREVKFNNGIDAYGKGCEFGDKGWTEARWRTHHSVYRNGDLYPTHGIGPIAHYININRGNRFMNLTCHSSKARGLHNHIIKKCGPDHPNAKVTFKLGDVVTTNITCANGETILLQHDTSLPRPYSLGFRVQGTNGLWMDVNKSMHIEGVSKPHQWEEAKTWLDKYDHPLWARWSKEAQGSGHGGMDFYVIHMFIESVKNNTAPQMDVYDAATWSAITPLSETSVARGNETVDFPDFTNGKWMYRKPVFALNDAY